MNGDIGEFQPEQLIAVNPITGEVNPEFAIATGTFEVVYEMNTICGETDTALLVLEPAVDAFFEYLPNEFCFGEIDTISPLLVNTSGVFTVTRRDQASDVLTISDDTLGTLVLSQSDPGTYQLTHAVSGNCPDEFSQDVTLFEEVFIGDLGVDPGYEICGDSVLTVTLNASQTGRPLFYLNGTLAFADFPIYRETNLSDTMFIRIEFIANSGCTVDTTILVTQKLRPNGEPRTYPETISGDEGVEILMEALTDNTSFIWTANATPENLIALDSTSGVVGPIGITETVPIVNTVFLETDIDPAQIEYVITPLRDSCPGEPDTLTVLVNPNGESVFIPGVFTPNGDGDNEFWRIQWNPLLIDANTHTILLYNRTGGLVKTMNPLVSDWDGENLPDGVYWYLLQDADGNMVKAGGLTIRRR